MREITILTIEGNPLITEFDRARCKEQTLLQGIIIVTSSGGILTKTTTIKDPPNQVISTDHLIMCDFPHDPIMGDNNNSTEPTESQLLKDPSFVGGRL